LGLVTKLSWVGGRHLIKPSVLGAGVIFSLNGEFVLVFKLRKGIVMFIVALRTRKYECIRSTQNKWLSYWSNLA